MLEILAPELCQGPDRIEQIGRIAAHISDFSLAALRGMPTLSKPHRTPLKPTRRPSLRVKASSHV